MSTLRQLNCPNCGGAVNVPPGAVRAVCPYCRSQLSVDVNTSELTLYIASQAELGKDKDRLAMERKQICDWYIEYYDKVQNLDEALVRLRHFQQTPIISDELQQLLTRRQQYIQQLDAWRQQVAQLDWIISPGINTSLPFPAPLPALRRRISGTIGCFGLLVLIGIVAIVFSLANQKAIPKAVPGGLTPTATAVDEPRSTEQPSSRVILDPEPPGAGYLYFKEASHSISAFAQTFMELGGVASLVSPITEAFIVQYFERAVMEYHPEAKPPFDVQLTAPGSLRLKQLYSQGAPSHASDPVPEQ